MIGIVLQDIAGQTYDNDVPAIIIIFNKLCTRKATWLISFFADRPCYNTYEYTV